MKCEYCNKKLKNKKEYLEELNPDTLKIINIFYFCNKKCSNNYQEKRIKELSRHHL